MRAHVLLIALAMFSTACSISTPSDSEESAFRAALGGRSAALAKRSKTGRMADVTALAHYLGRLHPPVRGGKLTSNFGWRSSRFHEGIDIAAPHGTPIRAAHDGEVIFVSNGFYGYGRTILVRSGGLVTLYAHNSANHVEVGEWVDRGEPIADVGATGDASGPHCHFEVRVQDESGRYIAVNPIRFLNRGA
jgi:murein DD-endopeptidase MepM/ murein hydrolase activator NlpD